MKVLIISNDFYPVNKIGALRINAFAKYFHFAGHSVTVLTEGEKDECVQWGGCQVHYVKDPVMTDASSVISFGKIRKCCLVTGTG